jgi:hypothetical protein
MKNRKKIAGILIAFIISTVPVYLHAGSWNWTRPYKMPEKNIETLILVGNYRQPRMLAELVQNETKQPILVIPASGEGNVFFMPADRDDKTMEIKLGDLTDFIKFVKPNKIIVLGDNRYVPAKYLAEIDPSQTVITVTNKEWAMVAKTTSRILDLKYLIKDFKAQQDLLKSGKLYRPNSGQASQVSPIMPTDDLVVDEIIVSEEIVIEDKLEPVEAKDPAPTMQEPKLIDESMVVPK